MFSGGSRKLKIRPTKPRSVSIMVEYQKSHMLALIGLIKHECYVDLPQVDFNQLEELFY